MSISDIILLQELWLYPDELSYLSNLCSNFCSYSISSMTLDDKLIRGPTSQWNGCNVEENPRTRRHNSPIL